MDLSIGSENSKDYDPNVSPFSRLDDIKRTPFQDISNGLDNRSVSEKKNAEIVKTKLKRPSDITLSEIDGILNDLSPSNKDTNNFQEINKQNFAKLDQEKAPWYGLDELDLTTQAMHEYTPSDGFSLNYTDGENDSLTLDNTTESPGFTGQLFATDGRKSIEAIPQFMVLTTEKEDIFCIDRCKKTPPINITVDLLKSKEVASALALDLGTQSVPLAQEMTGTNHRRRLSTELEDEVQLTCSRKFRTLKVIISAFFPYKKSGRCNRR